MVEKEKVLTDQSEENNEGDSIGNNTDGDSIGNNTDGDSIDNSNQGDSTEEDSCGTNNNINNEEEGIENSFIFAVPRKSLSKLSEGVSVNSTPAFQCLDEVNKIISVMLCNCSVLSFN